MQIVPIEKSQFWRRYRLRLVLLVVGVVSALLARPAYHLVRTAWQDQDQRLPVAIGWTDDASRMNRTAIKEVVTISGSVAEAERQLAEILAKARAEGLKVSIAGTRHSMGGHTIYPGGVLIDMLPFKQMKLHQHSGILQVQAGATWKEVIAFLDPRGRSVAVMQSNNSFSVGGSISVNAHGWVHGEPPIASSVQSLRLLQADGTVVHCSREQNSELFSLVLGGYGLFGIILEVNLRTVANQRYRLETLVLPADESIAAYHRKIQNRSEVRMAYARMNVSRDHFMDELILYLFVEDPAPEGHIPPLSDPAFLRLRRHIFRSSVASDYGKRLRWNAESKLKPIITAADFSRNQLLNEGVEVFQNRSADSTDILHEYFIPAVTVAAFVREMQMIIPKHQGDLLNVTVRQVEQDNDTFLRYADQRMFAFVLLFNQARTEAADLKMKAMTQALIEAALHHGGRYYLPYRLHATVDQFYRAYPQAREFFIRKRHYDPEELFQNRFYTQYGGRADVGAQED